MVRTVAAALCALAACLPARADVPASPDDEEDPRWTAPDPELVELPRIRLELWGRVTGLVGARVRKGDERDVHTIDLHRDTRIPRVPALGWRALCDVRFHEDWLVGGQIGQLRLEGPRRRLHYRGISINGRYVAPLPARTKIDAWLGEVFVRYVIRDNARVRFMLGIGAAWATLRLRVSARANRTDGRVMDVFGPTIGYHIAIQILPPVVAFAESLTALISPKRFPSYASDVRVGLRLPLGGGVEIGAAFSLTSVAVEDVRDLWGKGRPHLNRRFKRASWTAIGCDIGFAWRF